MSTSLTHVALHVPDVAVAARFYETLCGWRVIHARESGVVWLAEPGREQEMILVVMGGGQAREYQDGDYGHLGFAVATRADVDAIAARAKELGCLLWPPREDPWPVGYYCGVLDPAGNAVEFSYGQPLGPGAPDLDLEALARGSEP